MTFLEILKLINTDAHFDTQAAVESGGCTICFDDHIEITFENHENHLYLFSPVMQVTQPLSPEFFSSLLQMQLFGIATNRCWFGYDAGGQRVILFCLIELSTQTADASLKRIEILVEQVRYWKENLPQIAQATQNQLLDYSLTPNFKKSFPL
ncbi:hypothetical protein BL250_02115 [Erwinia sp. OLTSP20]|uniref:type III secretion system chaperone n=1 Tax=unclassified Erwinia TaxID=2622719 RepID=UPI000C17940F|nr:MULTISPECIES: type III secretion system chaperone [unclassified Erwinia]PIJ52034.1 hypothetical protein BV501_01205 [Erwinia sp. OAMSP11]PIJ75197.1 hypothetical protein BK416_02125 [Erwinia sp. OLSSP12]PIJ84404.1 hypothetical protein BLD47_02020 [Erwinia sp. OLCASP19]PIJ87018.1 hypothetical protein BLD46_01605 [Erwinia sp. OLMTSP26]PIJ88581.1 hypothetical protein BLD49_01185 [Erwinia sp. OLMDSP33]